MIDQPSNLCCGMIMLTEFDLIAFRRVEISDTEEDGVACKICRPLLSIRNMIVMQDPANVSDCSNQGARH